MNRNQLRGMIRSAVRARFGLLAEEKVDGKARNTNVTIEGVSTDVQYINVEADSDLKIMKLEVLNEKNDRVFAFNSELTPDFSEGLDLTAYEKGFYGIRDQPGGTYKFVIYTGNAIDERRTIIRDTVILSLDLAGPGEASDADQAVDTNTFSGPLGSYSVESEKGERALVLTPSMNGEGLVYNMTVTPLRVIGPITLEKGVPVRVVKFSDVRIGSGAVADVGISLSVPREFTEVVRNFNETIFSGVVGPEGAKDAILGVDSPTSSSSTASSGADATAGTDTSSTPAAPQVTSTDMTVKEKIRRGAKAIQQDFADVVTSPIDLASVKSANQMDGHTWIDNTDGARKPYNLRDWSKGDEYMYFALVSNASQKPVAFVVASDPEQNKHYSTGRFIGPDSTQRKLRTAFCILYKRATGEVYPGCESGSGSAASSSSSASSPGKEGGPGAIRIVAADGAARKGKGDAMTGVLGIGLRPAEKLRSAGRKIITKAKDREGFTTFPEGPEGVFRRDPLFTPGGKIPPSSLAVRFKNPVGIVVDGNGLNPYINFGDNKAADILFIKLGWGGRGLRMFDLRPDDPGFDEAAKWIFDNPEEFDLRPDEIRVIDQVAVDAAVPAEQRGAALGEGALNRARTTRSLTPLLDRYRF